MGIGDFINIEYTEKPLGFLKPFNLNYHRLYYYFTRKLFISKWANHDDTYFKVIVKHWTICKFHGGTRIWLWGHLKIKLLSIN